MQSAVPLAVVFAISVAAAEAAARDEGQPQSSANRLHRRCDKIERDIEAIDIAGYARGAAVLDVLVTSVVPSVTAMNGVQSQCIGIVLGDGNADEISFFVPSVEIEGGVLAYCAAPAPCQVGVIYHVAATIEAGDLWVRSSERIVAIDHLLDGSCSGDSLPSDRDGH